MWLFQKVQAVFLLLFILISSLLGTGGLPAKITMPDTKAGALGAYADPFVGTGGLPWVTGMLWPGATVPHGTVKLGPNTCFAGGIDFFPTNGYYYGHGFTRGFSHTVLEGGNFRVTPALGNTDPARRMKNPLPFSHKNEAAAPGYYAVYLPSIACLAELTATARTGVHRYTFGSSKEAHIFIDAASFLRDGSAQDGKIKVDPDTMEITGEARVSASFTKRYGGLTGYFIARFDRPFESYATWAGGVSVSGRAEAAGDDVGADLNFGNSAGQPIELKVGISFVSLENARENLEAEAGRLDFDGVRAAARDAWEAQLSKIKIETGDEKVKKIFYTSLHHSMTMPVNFTDVNGEYHGFDRQTHSTGGEFTYYTDMSLWDTFRTAHPLYTLVSPDLQLDCVKSLLEMAKIGGALPRWPSGAGYTGSMFGSPADMVVAETYLKGIAEFDVEAAYAFMKKVSDEVMAPGRDGRSHVDAYNRYGYLPADIETKGSVSSTLEYAWADASIALLAEALGKDEAEIAHYRDKSMNYKNLFDPSVKYFRARNSDGTWVSPFSPLVSSYYNEMLFMFPKAYAEGSAQHYRWSVPQDPQGLIGLFGSKEYFVKELDKFMRGASRNMAALDPGPGYWHGNQHNLHAIYMFNEAGRPDLTQKWARWALTERYGTGPDGLDGNDDAGTLSAWYVLSALGIYPVAGTDRYWLGAPIVDEARLQLKGGVLTVKAVNQGAKNVYVKSVTFNGAALDPRETFPHELIENGGTLEFTMADKP